LGLNGRWFFKGHGTQAVHQGRMKIKIGEFQGKYLKFIRKDA
jgi:hypothetical protein